MFRIHDDISVVMLQIGKISRHSSGLDSYATFGLYLRFGNIELPKTTYYDIVEAKKSAETLIVDITRDYDVAKRSDISGKAQSKKRDSTVRKAVKSNPGSKSKRAKAPASEPAAVAREKAEPVKTHLTTDELAYFHQLLLSKRERIVGDVKGLADQAFGKSRSEAAGDLSSMPIHMADIGTDNYDQEFAIDLLTNESNLVQEIDRALERIAGNTYGRCLATGKPISKARLKLKPWAKYCIKYERNQEKQNNSH